MQLVEKALLVVLASGLLTVAGFALYARIQSARRRIGAWAGERGYELIDVRRDWHEGQIVYRVVVFDRRRHVRKGWVRVGDGVEAQMDDPDLRAAAEGACDG